MVAMRRALPCVRGKAAHESLASTQRRSTADEFGAPTLRGRMNNEIDRQCPLAGDNTHVSPRRALGREYATVGGLGST